MFKIEYLRRIPKYDRDGWLFGEREPQFEKKIEFDNFKDALIAYRNSRYLSPDHLFYVIEFYENGKKRNVDEEARNEIPKIVPLRSLKLEQSDLFDEDTPI
ncbi:MAG: hypothetical protein ISN29_02025 [Gammaproteobacteria bacterium AqS3]|nr:hypothetical protein [Gammaproteobacteria bacterium AqS3]